MCCIVHKPSGIDVPQDIFKKIWSANPHGSGLMYAVDGKLVIVKGLMTLDALIETYAEHKCAEKEVIIHFRLASAGNIIPEQTHPFWVFENKLAFVHNGHIAEYDTGGVKQSDTMVFNQEILSKLPQNFLNNSAIITLLADYISGSVMVFMDNVGGIKVVGDTACSIFLNDCWFSNNYWQGDESSETTMDGLDDDEYETTFPPENLT